MKITQDEITDGRIDRLSEWKVFMIKQHPVNRFLDVYMRFCQKYREKNKVKCLNCFSDLNCIISKMYKLIDKKSRNVMDKSYHEEYFFPYTWNFSPIEGIDINIIDMENDNQMKFKIGKELIHLNISTHNIKDTFNIISNFSKSYADRKNKIRRKLNGETLYYNKLLLRKFASMYYCDFKYFGFDIPQFKKLMYF
uniref:Zn_Tnp_IS91 domain-containing protein n=1 Tax=Strongyloides papillosus TaxID=174720 RepID=A0A0N5BT43_STREA